MGGDGPEGLKRRLGVSRRVGESRRVAKKSRAGKEACKDGNRPLPCFGRFAALEMGLISYCHLPTSWTESTFFILRLTS